MSIACVHVWYRHLWSYKLVANIHSSYSFTVTGWLHHAQLPWHLQHFSDMALEKFGHS